MNKLTSIAVALIAITMVPPVWSNVVPSSWGENEECDDSGGMSPADVLNAKGFALLEEVCDTDENAMISPFSIYACLGQVWLAAKGETASELERVLGFDRESKPLIRRAIESWKEVCDATIRTANSLWLSPHTEVNDSYYAAVGKTFGSIFHSADFSCPKKAAMEINRFVSDATNGKIRQAVDSSDFGGNMRAVIVNALYFFSKWKDPFLRAKTCPEEFKRPRSFGGFLGGGKKVRMMHGTRKVPYAEWGGAQAIALPYRSSQFEFMVVLPQKDHSQLEILKKLSETGLKPLRQAMSRAEVKISLPKVSVRSRFKLKDVLMRMGVSRQNVHLLGANIHCGRRGG